MRKSRIFHLDKDMPLETWNPIIGCLHRCYGDGCWASITAEKLRHNPTIDRYKEGFLKPKLIEAELSKRFSTNVVVFVTSMGDMWGNWVPDQWIGRVLEATKASPETTFFFETKNPARYFKFLDAIPEKAILSATIETNGPYKVSKAPPVEERVRAMEALDWPRKHISVEPIMDFDHDIFVDRISRVRPEYVSVGYDNYGNRLPEPPLEKTMKLIEEMEQFTKVERKVLRDARR